MGATETKHFLATLACYFDTWEFTHQTACNYNILHIHYAVAKVITQIKQLFNALDIDMFPYNHHCNKLTTSGFTSRPHSICLAGTCHVTNQFIPTVTAVSSHLVESCFLGSIHPTIVWVHECTTVRNWRGRIATLNKQVQQGGTYINSGWLYTRLVQSCSIESATILTLQFCTQILCSC